MKRGNSLAASALTILLATTGGDRALARSTAPPANELDSLVRVFRASGEEIGLAPMMAELAKADAVFLGETHLDETTHMLEAFVYRQLIDARDGKVVLALEMFERDVQGALDDYLAGRINEPDFLARSRPWSNYHTGYRPMIELAKSKQLAVVASNAPNALLRKIGGAKDGWAKLSDADRALLPSEIMPNSEHYWQRFFRSTRSHGAMAAPSPDAMLYSTQCLWDNTMGDSCARALARGNGVSVLHVNGGFHSEFHEGTVGQLERRRPEVQVATVSINPVRALPTANADETWEPEIADYIVLTHQRGRDIFEGTHGVPMDSELRYHLWMPTSASPEQPVPLLIWLTGEGARPRDCLELLKRALGDAAAIAVVEGLHPQRDQDLHLGHRWFWNDTFDRFQKDLGATHAVVARIAGYLGRRFPVRSDRLVVAGEGEGATVVLAASLNATPDVWRGVAFGPRGFRSLRFLSLPEKNGGLQGLDVFAAEPDMSLLQEEAKQYQTVGLPVAVKALPETTASFSFLEGELRHALGLPARTIAKSDSAVVLLAVTDTPLARSWQRWHAYALEIAGNRVRVTSPDQLATVLATPEWQKASVRALAVEGEDLLPAAASPSWSARDFADGRGLPLAPGSFGGTTVLYVPNANADQRAAWLKLETDSVLKKRSMFANLAVAFADGDHTLSTALSALKAKGRRSILIVPATFCSPPSLMAKLEQETRSVADDFDISWLPGLGADLIQLGKP